MTDMALAVEQTAKKSPSLVARFAGKYGVDADKLMTTLKATAFKGDVSNEAMMTLLVVAEQYNLNPWTKEIYAFPDKQNGIVPVVGVDGWVRIVNDHPAFDGVDFLDGEPDENGLPVWIECTIYRKDRAHPTRLREYMRECKRNTPPWNSHPRRMLRHKALVQCARVAFGFSGIYDEDEARRIIDMGSVQTADTAPAVAAINARIATKTMPAQPSAEDIDDATLPEDTKCPHGLPFDACQTCLEAGDHAHDAAREKQLFSR